MSDDSTNRCVGIERAKLHDSLQCEFGVGQSRERIDLHLRIIFWVQIDGSLSGQKFCRTVLRWRWRGRGDVGIAIDECYRRAKLGVVGWSKEEPVIGGPDEIFVSAILEAFLHRACTIVSPGIIHEQQSLTRSRGLMTLALAANATRKIKQPQLRIWLVSTNGPIEAPLVRSEFVACGLKRINDFLSGESPRIHSPIQTI